MPEPHSTAVGLAIGAGIGLTGTVMGASVDALLVGLFAAILVSIWMPSIDNRVKAASAVAFATLLAGWGSDVAAGWVAVNQTGIQDATPLRLLLALMIGGAAPTVMPTAMERLKAIIKGGSS